MSGTRTRQCIGTSSIGYSSIDKFHRLFFCPCVGAAAPRSAWATPLGASGSAGPWRSSINRRFSCFSACPLRFSRSDHPRAIWSHRREPLQPKARRKHWSKKTILCGTITLRAEHSVDIQPYDEEEKGTGDRKPARHEARQYHRLHQWSAVGSPPRPSTNTPRIAQSELAGAGKQQIVAPHHEDLRRRRHAVGCHWRARPPSTSQPQRDHSLPTTAACAGACC